MNSNHIISIYHLSLSILSIIYNSYFNLPFTACGVSNTSSVCLTSDVGVTTFFCFRFFMYFIIKSSITMKLIKNPFIINNDINIGPSPSNHIDFVLKMVRINHKNENKLSFNIPIMLSLLFLNGFTVLMNISAMN